MKEFELEHSRKSVDDKNIIRIRNLETWFKNDYVSRLLTIQRYIYLGLTPPETRYSLEMEAYKKENELRKLKGLSPLPETKIKDLL